MPHVPLEFYEGILRLCPDRVTRSFFILFTYRPARVQPRSFQIEWPPLLRHAPGSGHRLAKLRHSVLRPRLEKPQDRRAGPALRCGGKSAERFWTLCPLMDRVSLLAEILRFVKIFLPTGRNLVN